MIELSKTLEMVDIWEGKINEGTVVMMSLNNGAGECQAAHEMSRDRMNRSIAELGRGHLGVAD